MIFNFFKEKTQQLNGKFLSVKQQISQLSFKGNYVGIV